MILCHNKFTIDIDIDIVSIIIGYGYDKLALYLFPTHAVQAARFSAVLQILSSAEGCDCLAECRERFSF